MARTFSNANWLAKGSALLTAEPFTFAAWIFNTATPSNFPTIMTISDSGQANGWILGLLSGAQVYAQVLGAGGGYGQTSTTVSLNTWTHTAGVFASSASRIAYMNGGNSGSNAASRVTGTVTDSRIGGFSGTSGLAGAVAFPAIWNVALSATDIAALAAGAHPRSIRPDALVACLNLTGNSSPEPDLVSAGGWSLSGTPTESANPRIYLS